MTDKLAKIVFMTGAGISKESGIATFRDSADGLWNNYKIEDVATIDGWRKDPTTVLEFYNARRREVQAAEPNAAHRIIAELEKDYEVTIITQNVDDLHERAGSTNVIHLHGELMRAREDSDSSLLFDREPKSIPWNKDINLGDYSEDGYQLRPDIVWFGEYVKGLIKSYTEVSQADAYVIVGTSLQVYPANTLHGSMNHMAVGFLIDPKPDHMIEDFYCIEKPATEGMADLVKLLKEVQDKMEQ